MTIKSISSRDNPLYKELKLLATNSQARRKAEQTLLDGIHLCEAFLQHVGMPSLCIVSEQAHSNAEVSAILARCERGHARCVMLTNSLYQALSQVEHGIELMFVVATPRLQPPDEIIRDAVLLDNLQDPGNLGSILRSAAAAGINQIFCGPGTAFAWSPKVLRAGMGAHFALKIFENVDLASLMRRSRVPVFATSSHAQCLIYDVDLKRPVAWLFGHEGQGVNKDLLDLAAEQVAIPHLGPIESLNVAASAAVCFFEQVRQKAIH